MTAARPSQMCRPREPLSDDWIVLLARNVDTTTRARSSLDSDAAS